MQVIGAADGTMDKKTLLKAAQQHLTPVFRNVLDPQIERDRFEQVKNALRNELFYTGHQHVVLDEREGVLTWTGSYEDPKDPSTHQLSYHINITRSDGQKFKAVVGARPPKAKAVPDNPSSTVMCRNADQGNAGLRYLERQWNARRIQKDIAGVLWTTGPAFLYTRPVTDGGLYGYREELDFSETEEIELDSGSYLCPGCGVGSPANQCASCGMDLGEETFTPPKMASVPKPSTRKYANSGVQIDVFSILEVVVPGHATVLRECEYLRLERELAASRLYDLYAEVLGPDWLEKHGENVGNDTLSGGSSAQDARERLRTTDALLKGERQYMVTETDDWLRPMNYAHIKDEEFRSALEKQFPNGLHVVRVDGKVVDLKHEKMDDFWAPVKTGTGKRILSDPLVADIIPLNEKLNDLWNMAMQTVLQAIPKTLIDSGLMTKEAAERPVVGEVIPVNMKGQDANRLIKELPTARFSDQLIPLATTIREMSRELDGVMSSLFGGGEKYQTAEEANMRKDQALQMLMLAYHEMVEGWQVAYMNGLRILSEIGIDQVFVPKESTLFGQEADILDLDALPVDGYTVQVIDTVPRTEAERAMHVRDLVQQLNPEVLNAWGLTHPASIPAIHRIMDLEGIYSPQEAMRDVVMERIQLLLLEPPIQDVDPMTGQMVMRSSIPVDPVFDDSPIMFEMFRAWACSSAGRRAKEEMPEGFENVRLHAQEHQMAMQPPPAPMDPNAMPPEGPPPEQVMA